MTKKIAGASASQLKFRGAHGNGYTRPNANDRAMRRELQRDSKRNAKADQKRSQGFA